MRAQMRCAARSTGQWLNSVCLGSPPLRSSRERGPISDKSTSWSSHRLVQRYSAEQDPVATEVVPPTRIAEDPAVFDVEEQTVGKWTKFSAVLGVVSAVLVR